MALTGIQRRVLRVIAPNRGPGNYVAGGAILNRRSFRLSDDIDIFADEAPSVVRIAEADMALLREAGFVVDVRILQFADAEAVVADGTESTLIQWMDETTRRFFPVQKDPDFGWRLHDADMAVNKVLAASSRFAARDAVDVARLHREFLPLPYLAWAAAGKTAFSPARILDEIVRHAVAHPREEYLELRSELLVDPADVLATLMEARQAADAVFEALPVEAYGALFVGAGDAVVAASPEDIAEGRARPVTPTVF